MYVCYVFVSHVSNILRTIMAQTSVSQNVRSPCKVCATDWIVAGAEERAEDQRRLGVQRLKTIYNYTWSGI